MRATGCTVQQSLTTEAASVVKQAVVLARRRGHAQVTPLHVASTMLSASGGLLRTACLQSHSHPLQCKALELCFNVALNRLPASSSSTMLGGAPHHGSQHPSISNALVAAFKRAQAHQRRGSVENQQQPPLAVKIELEHLIISILDDPSVSRVMREAGFSSTQVKSNIEQTVSFNISSHQTPSPSSKSSKENNLLSDLSQTPSIVGEIGINMISKPKESHDQVTNEDVISVIDVLMNKRRKNLVIVGENLASIEGVVREVKDRVDKGDVPATLREVKFTSFPLASFGQLSREEVGQKFGELRLLVNSFVDKGIVLYLGDLKWITECVAQGRNNYCPVEHMIMELGRLVYGVGDSGRFWLMGIATLQTYMSSRTSQYSFETIWNLQPVIIPAGSLGLSLIPDCEAQSDEYTTKNSGNDTSWLNLIEAEKENKLTCCAHCLLSFQAEARSLQNSTSNNDSTFSRLPSWLRDESIKRINNSNDKNSVDMTKLCEKWNSICSSIHKNCNTLDRTLTFSSISLSSCFSFDQRQSNLQQSTDQAKALFENDKSRMNHPFWNLSAIEKTGEPSLRLYFPEHSDPKHDFSSNPNSTPTSASSSDPMEMEYVHRFKEFNTENLNTLCNALEQKVPWQKDIIPEIAGTVLKCRSGMLGRKDSPRSGETKEETWLLFKGVDVKSKEKIARELAKVVFGSHSSIVSIGLSSFSSTRTDSSEDCRNKRSRDEQSCSYVERFAEAVSANPHRVFFVEDVEQADYCSLMGIKRAIERGRITNSLGEEMNLYDAILILSCETFSFSSRSRSRACSPSARARQRSEGSEREKSGDGLEETCGNMSLDLNISFDDHVPDYDCDAHLIDEVGLLESVDRCIMFKAQEL